MVCKVLLVDDEVQVTDALKRALHKESYSIFDANSAERAFEILEREKIDVVVSDEMMPGMMGSDLLAVVCRKYPETIRIMLTGHPNLNTALRAINNGHIYRFLTKPCSAAELDVVIRQAMQHRELSKKSMCLLGTVKRQNTILEDLENRYPGISSVTRDEEGVISLDSESDLDELFREMDAEMARSESFFKSSK